MEVVVTYKRIKNLHLRVKDGKVYVSSPFRVSKAQIEKFVNMNVDFINKQIEKQEKTKEKRTFNINDEIVILNKKYTILSTHQRIKKTDNFIFVNENLDISKQLKILFKDDLLVYLKDLSLKYFQIMSLQCLPPKIIIKDVKSKWGSYNKNKHEIIYSSNLIFKNTSCYDYLVVHELAHIVEFNHSKRFYNLVEKYIPNYKVLKKELKED